MMLHDVAAGMSYLHARNHIHGDLRSPNLFVGADGKVGWQPGGWGVEGGQRHRDAQGWGGGREGGAFAGPSDGRRVDKGRAEAGVCGGGGVSYLHARNHIHGDLRSPNLFVGPDGKVCSTGKWGQIVAGG